MNIDTVIQMIKRYKLLLVGAAFLILLGVLIYNIAIFRVISTSPSFSRMPSSVRILKLNFTQPVKSIDNVELAGKSILPRDVSIDGRTVRIKIPSGGFEADIQTSIRFSKATSGWFGFTTTNYLQRFTPVYLEFNQLTEEQQKDAVDASDSAQSNDPFLNNNFPLITDDFTIDATKDEENSNIFVTISFAKDIPDYDNGGSVTGVTGQEAETLKKKALEFIESKNGTPEDYSISYTNPYLNEKYTNSIDR